MATKKSSPLMTSIRKWFRIIHRDMGYLIFGFTMIYAVSGIALNHIEDWDPSYIHDVEEVSYPLKGNPSETEMKEWLQTIRPDLRYRKHAVAGNQIRVFVKSGLVEINTDTNTAKIELVTRRPIFNQINTLHYNKTSYWVWFSDIFSVILIVVCITGLFIVKGKNSITQRGLYWTLAGILIPLYFIFQIM